LLSLTDGIIIPVESEVNRHVIQGKSVAADHIQ
jgi:hypothetical protein